MWNVPLFMVWESQDLDRASERVGQRVGQRFKQYFFLSCCISLSLFPFPTENCMGFGLEMAGKGCSQCRGFQLLDPKLLWCGGAALEEENG
jgi:hypothetical protein